MFTAFISFLSTVLHHLLSELLAAFTPWCPSSIWRYHCNKFLLWCVSEWKSLPPKNFLVNSKSVEKATALSPYCRWRSDHEKFKCSLFRSWISVAGSLQGQVGLTSLRNSEGLGIGRPGAVFYLPCSSSELEWLSWTTNTSCIGQHRFSMPQFSTYLQFSLLRSWGEGATFLFFSSSNHCCLETWHEYEWASESWVRAPGKPRKVEGTMRVFLSM